MRKDRYTMLCLGYLGGLFFFLRNEKQVKNPWGMNWCGSKEKTRISDSVAAGRALQ
jgi:hypothetical protein